MSFEEPLMTIKDVSKFLKVNEASIRRWTNMGRLKCYRVGNKKERRFDKKDVMRYLKCNSVK